MGFTRPHPKVLGFVPFSSRPTACPSPDCSIHGSVATIEPFSSLSNISRAADIASKALSSTTPLTLLRSLTHHSIMVKERKEQVHWGRPDRPRNAITWELLSKITRRRRRRATPAPWQGYRVISLDAIWRCKPNLGALTATGARTSCRRSCQQPFYQAWTS